MKTTNLLKFLILFVPFTAIPLAGWAQTDHVITIVPTTTEHHKYCLGLLKLALSYSNDNYSFKDNPIGSGGLERDLVQLKEGKIDVIWSAASNYMETKAHPIRIPLYRGLLGHRILLIRKGDGKRFEQVETIEDLKAFKFGQGEDWTDTAILRASNFKVVPSHSYENLFHMLDGNRFDAFPRGLYEPWSELKTWNELDLEVEKSLAISYKMPLYFFVSKDNPLLAEQIENGLNKALDDGSFDRYFFDDPTIKEALVKANMNDRKIFHLPNPNLPPTTPLEDNRLWWSPMKN